MIERQLLKIRKRFSFSEAEERMLRDAMTDTMRFKREGMIVPENEKLGYSCLLVEGFACRATWLPSGERQIMEINIPGDFVDMHSYPLEWLDHNVTALTDCTMMKLPHPAISRMIEAHPRVGRIFWFNTMLDASIHREWLVSLGRRTALERIGHLFCELYHRLKVVDLVDPDDSYALPLRQGDLANALGLTTVHINRKLRELREMKLCSFNDRRVRILNLAELEQVSQFDTNYLFLEPRKA